MRIIQTGNEATTLLMLSEAVVLSIATFAGYDDAPTRSSLEHNRSWSELTNSVSVPKALIIPLCGFKDPRIARFVNPWW